jgi:hypothetical protein
VYLDPFGLKGCEFGAIKELLEKGDNRSTEILINVSMPILHRLAAPIAVKKGATSPRIATFHKILDDVLGGDYWRQHMFNEELSPDEKELRVM